MRQFLEAHDVLLNKHQTKQKMSTSAHSAPLLYSTLTKQSQVVRHKYREGIYGSLVIPKLAILTMMVFLQSRCEQKSTKSCKEVLKSLVRGSSPERKIKTRGERW